MRLCANGTFQKTRCGETRSRPETDPAHGLGQGNKRMHASRPGISPEKDKGRAVTPSLRFMMNENDQREVPAAPGPQFAVIHTRFPLALSNTGRDGSAYATDAHTHLQGSVSHSGFSADPLVVRQITFRAWQSIKRQDRAQDRIGTGHLLAFVAL